MHIYIPPHCEDDLSYARHSNIPRCCARFYVEFWRRWFAGGDKRRITNYRRRIQRRGWPIESDYIPCPKCLVLKRARTMHHCDERCDYSSEYRDGLPASMFAPSMRRAWRLP